MQNESSKAHCEKLKQGHLKDRIIGCQVSFSSAEEMKRRMMRTKTTSAFHIHDYLLMRDQTLDS